MDVSGGCKKTIADGKRIAQCDVVQEKISIMQHENVKIIAASKTLELQEENSNNEEIASENWNLITHKKTLRSRIGSSASPSNSQSWKKEAPAFVPKSVTRKKNESKALASELNAFASDEDLSEKELNDFTSDKDLYKEEKEELDICFEKVAWNGDLLPRKQKMEAARTKRRYMKGNIVGMVRYGGDS
ncbi:hypothetical protein T459_16932 [Capsicum annuum]|uniref:Uncharacterized protein n=1 Tax=Capsicum annuum TaxID=4072 RepID=A0A2G2ZA52_CAPAN|nr:hypothetical protein T459_16932 [Capsicum annuum]